MKNLLHKIPSAPPEPEPPVHIDVPPKLSEDFTSVAVTSSSTPISTTTIRVIPAAEKLATFLKENRIVLTPTVMSEQCTIADGGIILNDKPLIKIAVSYKE